MTPTLLREGRYQVLGELGEGSQGTTFDAIDRRVGQPVAIKRFRIRGAGSWKDVELAEREASVLAVLSHPKLPMHIEHFEEDGCLYLVMQKIDGTDVARLMRQGQLSQTDVVRFLEDAADVLGYLHGRSPPVIHRDLNPKNVIKRPDGSFAFVDFGAVRDKLKPEGGSTVVGTFGFMAPEQFQGRALPASDVYAVGATALSMLTGRAPEDLPHKGLRIDVRAALASLVDSRLVRVLDQMLDPDPDRRASSIAPLLGPLRQQNSDERRAAQGPTPPRPSDAEPAFERPNRRERRRARNRSRGGSDDARAAREEAEWRERQARYERRALRRRHGPPIPLVVFGLRMAMLVVALILGFFVPFLLSLLSIVLGRELRVAAHRVRETSLRVRGALRDAEEHLLYGSYAHPSGAEAHVEPPSPARARVATEEAEAHPGAHAPDPRYRAPEVHVDVIDTEGVDVTDTRRQER